MPVREPRARNVNGCHTGLWRKLGEFERHHYNKMYNYMYFNKEEFKTTKELTHEEWELFVRLTCQLSASTLRRGLQTSYRKVY